MRKLLLLPDRNSFLLFFILAAVNCFSQQDIKGRVVASGIPLPWRGVVNINSGAETKTDSLGNFTIKAAVSDTLSIETANVYSGRIIINEKDFTRLLVIDLGAYELEEVVIDNTLSAEELGLVPKGQRQYTPAEKKLQTAGEIKSVMDVVGILTGGKSFDAVINAVTGKTKRLKKELKTEKKEKLIENAVTIYTKEEIINTLKIPEEYVQGYLFFIAEDESLALAINEKNDEKAKFIMSGLAVKYIEIISEQ